MKRIRPQEVTLPESSEEKHGHSCHVCRRRDSRVNLPASPPTLSSYQCLMPRASCLLRAPFHPPRDQFVGSYHASGTDQWEGSVDGGNMENTRIAHSQDMGVFCISPSDKGGMLYKPSKVNRSPDLVWCGLVWPGVWPGVWHGVWDGALVHVHPALSIT